MEAVIMAVVIIFFIWLVIWIYQSINRKKFARRSAKWLSLYLWLDNQISELPITTANFKMLKEKLLELQGMNQNKERTQVITSNFYLGRWIHEAIKDACFRKDEKNRRVQFENEVINN